MSRHPRRNPNGAAIEAGEPADLLLNRWLPVYKKLGRDRFLEMLKNNAGISLSEAKKMLKRQ